MALHPNSTGTQYIANVMNLGGSMAIAAGTVWELRATGSDSNGGLFLSSQPGAGTDYSQQDAAQLTVTDGVTNGTATVTSVTGGFTAAMVGNGINIAGTCYMIATRSDTHTITVDRVIGANIGLTMNVGGALATPGFVAGQATATNKVWVKAGTYTFGSATPNIATGLVNSPGGTAGFPFVWEGYQTTRGDKGTKPVFASGSVNNQDLFSISSAYTIIDNIAVSSTQTGNSCIKCNAASIQAIRCKVSGVAIGFYVPASFASILFCEGNCTGTHAAFDIRAICFLESCVSHGSGVDGFAVTSSDTVIMLNCLSYGNTGAGFNSGAGFQVLYHSCTADANTTDGFLVSSSGAASGYYCTNCISTNNGGYGFNAAGASGFFALINCATYNNTSGATHNLTRAEGAIVLTGTPYSNAAGGNYGLNNTDGAGKAARGTGTPGALPGLPDTIAYPDLGAVQHQDTGGGGGGGMAGVYTLVINRIPS